LISWKKVKLKDIAKITMGQSPKSEYYNNNKEGLPFLQGNKTFGDKYPTYDKYTSFYIKIAKPNDVLISVRAPVGDLNISQDKICIGRGLCAISMNNKNNEFLYYLLKANIKKLINSETGTIFGSINKNDIENFTIEVPNDEYIQNKIVKILKNLDSKIYYNKKINQNIYIKN
jgi:type I restriction enzyme S subunit